MNKSEVRARKNSKVIRMYNKIAAFWFQFGQSPTFREIGKMCGVRSTSMINLYIQTLVRWGWINYQPGSNRTITLKRATEVTLNQAQGHALFGSVTADFEQEQIEAEARFKARMDEINNDARLTRVEQKAAMMNTLRRRRYIRAQIQPYNSEVKS